MEPDLATFIWLDKMISEHDRIRLHDGRLLVIECFVVMHLMLQCRFLMIPNTKLVCTRSFLPVQLVASVPPCYVTSGTLLGAGMCVSCVHVHIAEVFRRPAYMHAHTWNDPCQAL